MEYRAEQLIVGVCFLAASLIVLIATVLNLLGVFS